MNTSPTTTPKVITVEMRLVYGVEKFYCMDAGARSARPVSIGTKHAKTPSLMKTTPFFAPFFSLPGISRASRIARIRRFIRLNPTNKRVPQWQAAIDKLNAKL